MNLLTELPSKELLDLRMEAVLRLLSADELEAIMKACDCHWIHNGDPQAPHAELTSGKCSNGFINLRLVLCRLNLCQIMANQLIRLLTARYSGRIDWVMGSATASTNLAYEVARQLGAQTWPMQKGPEKTQLLESMVIPDDAVILHVEELMTTAGTARAVREGIRKVSPNVKFVPFLPVIAHRPEPGDCTGVDNSKVIYLAHYDIWTADPKDCTLCKQGSKPLRPAKNWQELTAGKAV